MWEKKLKNKVREYLKGHTACHDYYHLQRVQNYALEIAEKIDCDRDVLKAAALLHDIGYRYHEKDDKNHQRSWFVYVIKLDKKINRDKIINDLIVSGVPSKAYLPSIHLQPYMKTYGFKPGDFPVSEAESQSTLALPFYSGISQSTINFVCNHLTKILK